MRSTWVIGNWKQNHRREEAAACARSIAADLSSTLSGSHPSAGYVCVGIAPPYLSLDAAREHARPHSALYLLGQDCGAQDNGAFTGEVGPAMLQDAGVHGAIVGHSERRAYYGEDDALVARKLAASLGGGLVTVLCVGERLEARDAGEHESTVISQLSAAFADVKPEQINEHLVLAYEPVWAIGTGRTASPEQAGAMHATIRGWMTERFSEAGRDRSILYGGSVKPNNAEALIGAGDVDGFLVGGASLDPTSFLAIVRAASHTAR